MRRKGTRWGGGGGRGGAEWGGRGEVPLFAGVS